jgi:hypothetical protein
MVGSRMPQKELVVTASVTASDIPESFNGRHTPGSGNSVSLATRHLCAVTHMRRFMLTEESFESDPAETPPRRWVGRPYAIRVLLDEQPTGPTPGVDIETVKRTCWSALWQTLARDAAVVAVIATAASLDPRGTFIIIGLISAVIMMVGRVRISLPLVLAATILLALIVGSPQARDPFAVPLLAFSLCFLIYVADSFLASRRMRRVMRQTAKEAGSRASLGPDRAGPVITSETDGNGFSPGSRSDSYVNWPSPSRSQVFYGKEGIRGAGTPLTPVTFTVAVDKPQRGKLIDPFDVSGLLEHIAAYVMSQGTVNYAPDGFSHRRVWIKGEWHTLDIPPPQGNGFSPAPHRLNDQGNESFTYGLPNLDVGEVIATPGPKVRVRPLWLLVAVRLLLHAIRARQSQPIAADDIPAPSNSPSVFPERRYVRACTTTWDGELIVSVYIGAALQAHYLRLIIRPYVLAPMVPHLHQIQDIADRNVCVHLVLAIRGTVLGLFQAAAAANKLGSRRNRNDRRKRRRVPPLSTRERYAMSDTDSVHHQEDALRICQVIEMKIFKVMETYLEDHNVDTEDFKKQGQVLIDQSVKINDSQISGNLAVGTNNNQQQNRSGDKSGEGDGNGSGK